MFVKMKNKQKSKRRVNLPIFGDTRRALVPGSPPRGVLSGNHLFIHLVADDPTEQVRFLYVLEHLELAS